MNDVLFKFLYILFLFQASEHINASFTQNQVL